MTERLNLRLALRQVAGARLGRAFKWGSLQAMMRLVCSFLSIKITSVYLGPAGLALIAQFNNFVSLCEAIVATSLGTAAGRLTAEYGEDESRRRTLWGTVGRIGFWSAASVALLVAIASPWLARWLLLGADYWWVFLIGAFAAVAGIANTVLVATLAARGEVGLAAGAGILGTIAGVALYVPASVHFGVSGGLAASASAYIVAVAVTILIARRSPRMPLGEFRGRFDQGEARRIVRFYPMLIIHAVMVPLTPILVRNELTSLISLDATGLWQACWRLSDIYLIIVFMSISLHFQPRLGEVVNHPALLRQEVVRTVGAAIGVTASIGLCMFVLRRWIVHIVFAPAFLPVVDLMPVQLVGDVFKMGGWLAGFVLVATVRSGWFIVLEFIVPLIFVGGTRYLVPELGIKGVTWAYLTAYAIQCLLAWIALRDIIAGRYRPA